ncbi:MAG: hydroxysqualene synthase [Hyphomicrobiales bacterium]|jgi:squalene synthase HpnC|nr:hydroxysqualene synthase [Hyphomicrobiales bacterium]
MTTAGELRSGKGHRDENFPVASWLIDARHRGIILAFYEFVRIADDIADHATLKPEDKLAQLDRLEENLLGNGDDNAEAVRLRAALGRRGLPPRHAQDLLTAFRMDVTKLRYADWDDLIHYCSFSAMPVGRFVLDVHGESRATWATNDALCAALQINNHLQDCGKDFRELNRVYIPLDAFAAAGATPEELGAAQASPQLLRCIHDLAARNETLLRESEPFSGLIENTRLAHEVAVIHTYARHIVALLQARDPLSERVHLSKAQFALYGLGAVLINSLRRIGRPRPARKPQDAQRNA